MNKHNVLNYYFDEKQHRLVTYTYESEEELTMEQLMSDKKILAPLVLTADIQRNLDYFRNWLNTNTQSFILSGPEGCGKRFASVFLFYHLYTDILCG